jgi:hypothetical protein
LIGCGAVIDMRSGIGTLVIISSNNLPINVISTDPRHVGQPYMDIQIPDGFVCEVHGYTVILLYHHIVPPSTPLIEPLKETMQKCKDQTASAPRNIKPLRSPVATSAPEILIRIQLSPSGKLSPPYNKDVMRPKVSTIEFFTWFYNEANRIGVPFNSVSNESGLAKLTELAFTLKDAMPNPKTGFLTRGDEAHFMYMRKYIKEQYDKARAFCPGLREFAILVKVPGTVEADAADEEW